MKLKVGILGATGAVGQKFVRLLEDHPWFEISALAASSRSAGRAYKDAAHWVESSPIPPGISDLIVQEARPGLDCDFVFSGLDSSVAGDIESDFATAGYPVISNAKNFRMEADVPLIIPEVNPDHLILIERQSWEGGGYIVTNPNCATVGLTLALKPIEDAFGIEAVSVVTLQALSGAGYPGVSSLDSLGNVVPFISGEEEKLVTEPLKLLGDVSEDGIVDRSFPISAQCTRVPVMDGHLECVSVKLRRRGTAKQVETVLRDFQSPEVVRGLPSSPQHAILIVDEEDGPQPRKNVHTGRGMTVTIGRVRPCEILDVKMVVLSHNTIRGAAGGAILNAELLASKGLIPHREEVASSA